MRAARARRRCACACCCTRRGRLVRAPCATAGSPRARAVARAAASWCERGARQPPSRRTRAAARAAVAWCCLLYTSDAADDTPCVDL
eukprot:2153087-Pleurochrysis_carterae.AAC.1